MCLANETINSGFHMITLPRGGHVFVTSHELWILPMATNGNFFIAKYSSSFFSVQAGRGGVDRKPLTMEFLKKSFESSSVDPSLEDNREYQLAK